MSNIDSPDIKKKIEELVKTISPGMNSYRMTTRQKIAAGLRTNGLILNGFYKDTTSKIVEWRDKFCKDGHNILENKNKK